MSILDWFKWGQGNKKRKRLPPPKLARTQTDEYVKAMPDAYKLLAKTTYNNWLPVLRNIRALAEQPEWDGRRFKEALWHVRMGGYDNSPFTKKDVNAAALVFLAAAYETQMWRLPRVMTVREIDRLVAYLGANWPAKEPAQIRQPAKWTTSTKGAYKKSATYKVENTRILPPAELDSARIRKPWELNDQYSKYGWVRHTLMTFRVFVWSALIISLMSIGAAIGVGEFDIIAILQQIWAYVQEHWLLLLILLLLALLIAWLLRKLFKGRMKSKDGQPSDQQSQKGQKSDSGQASEGDDTEGEGSEGESSEGEQSSSKTQQSDLDPEDMAKPEGEKQASDSEVTQAQLSDETPEEGGEAKEVQIIEQQQEEEAAQEEKPEQEESKPEEDQKPEVDPELRKKLRDLLKELELEAEADNEAGAIEDAIERAEEAIERDVEAKTSKNIRNATYNHGGVTVALDELERRAGEVEPKLASEIERRLSSVLSVMDLCGTDPSMRLDGKKLVREMQARRANLSRIRRDELQTGTKLLMVDVSMSCERVAKYAMAAAAAILRRDPRCVLVVHSNGIPERVYGALEGSLPKPYECHNGYDVESWWAETIRRLNAVSALAGAVNWGDWDAGFVMRQLAEGGTPVVWFDHYSQHGVAQASASLRSGASDWSIQPIAWYEGVIDAESTALALRLADKRLRGKK